MTWTVRTTATPAMVGIAVPDLRERLALRMRQRRLNGKQLAEMSGVSEPNISKILTGRVLHPTSEQITRLATALGVPTDYLIGSDCPPSEADLPPDLRAQIAQMPPAYRGAISELVSKGAELPDTPEGRAAFVQGVRVAVGYWQSEIDRLKRQAP